MSKKTESSETQTHSNFVDLETPSTRYQGSKRRILPWLRDIFTELEFNDVLDGFGGTASVSYLLKSLGKSVTYNDILKSNYHTGVSYIQNSKIELSSNDIEFILTRNGFNYPDFIAKAFEGIYYTDTENSELDIIVKNINMMSEKYNGNKLATKKAIAFHCLYQSALSKRPFNLFHRKNLYIRTATDVERSFGNKQTWEKSFDFLFKKFAKEHAIRVFGNGQKNKARNKDLTEIKYRHFDLVYLDPPYRKAENVNATDYRFYYHFLEGMTDYDQWESRIDWTKRTRSLKAIGNSWNSSISDFRRVLENFPDSKIALSYWSPGYPTKKDLLKLIGRYKSKVKVYEKPHSYSLSKSNGKLQELLIVGED